MADTALITLVAGTLSVELNPSVGGSIWSFRKSVAGREFRLLRNGNSGSQNVLDAASFPLVPYVNRIRGGHFTFRGREVRLAPNMAGDISPLHGQGWLRPWAVATAAEGHATLEFRQQAGEWPWNYEARQKFALDEQGLSVRLTCRNLDGTPMPCGLGQHPYFDCGPDTRIDTVVTDAWTIDEHVLPIEKVPALGRFDLVDRPVCGQGLDHGFGGWSGSATIRDPDRSFAIVMSSPQARFFQLYSPEEGRIFVAEPVSHANAALNAPEEHWSGLGMRVLDPGEEMELDMRIEVTPG